MADVFISYSRRDSTFVRALHAFLTASGRDVWVDWEDIPAASEWAEDIDSSIDEAESVVFVVSTASVASRYCGEELAHAQKGGKRIVPIACEAVEPETATQGLRQLNWIWCRAGDDRDAAFAKLSAALDTDLEWARAHSRLLVRAVEWEATEDDSLLLRGRELARAEQALTAHASDAPTPTELQQRYVRASRAASSSRQRRLLAAAAVAVLVSLGAAGYAVLQRDSARSERNNATSVALASAADNLSPDDPDVSLLLALDAYRAKATAQARSAVISGLESVRRTGADAILRTHQRRVHGLAYSPDGRLLATAGGDGTVGLFDGMTRASLGEPLDAGQGAVLGVAFSPDGRMLASAAANEGGTVVLWDAGTHEQIGVLRGHRGSVHGVAFSPDGKLLASAGDDGTVRLWDPRSHRPLGTLDGGQGPVWGVAVSADGALAAAGSDGTVQLWDAPSRQKLGAPLRAQGGGVHAVAFSPDARRLAAAGEDGTLLLWDPATRTRLGRIDAGDGPLYGVAFSPDGSTLASAGATVRLWDPATLRQEGAPRDGDQAPAYDVAFAPDGRTIASAGEDGTVVVWPAAPREGLAARLPGTQEHVRGVAFSPDGGAVASGGSDGSVVLHDARTHRQVGRALGVGPGPVRGIAFDPRGRVLATAAPRLLLWDLATGEDGRPLGGNAAVASLAFSGDGSTIAAGGDGGSVLLRDPDTGEQRGQPLTGHRGRVLAVAFAPDGRTLASAGRDGTVRLWDTRSQRQLGEPLTGSRPNPAGDRDVFAVAFSPDGRLLAAGGVDGAVRLWDARSREPAGEPLNGLQDHVRGLAFAADGRTLASVGDNGTLLLWDPVTHTRLGKLRLGGSQGALLGVAFSPDGRTIATAGSDGTVALWEGLLWRDAADLEAQVCSLIAGDLSEAEWSRLGTGLRYRSSCPG